MLPSTSKQLTVPAGPRLAQQEPEMVFQAVCQPGGTTAALRVCQASCTPAV